MAACEMCGMEFKQPWHIFGVDVMQNAAWHDIVKVAVDQGGHSRRLL